MSTVAPPPPPSLPTAPVPSLPTVTVTAPPPALLAAPLNARLEGQVLAQLGQGQFQIQTPLGLLTVQSAIALPRDAFLTLVVQALSPQVELQIAAVDGRPAAAALRATAPAAPGGGAAQVPVPGGLPTVTLTAGSTTIATVLRPPAGALGRLDAAAGAAPFVQAGTPTVAGGGLPGAGAPASPSGAVPPAPPGVPLPGGTAAATPATGGQQGSFPVANTAGTPSAPSPDAFPRPGAEFPVRVVTVQPPTTDGAPPPAPRAATAALGTGAVLAGTVMRAIPSGNTVLATSVGELSLPLRGALSPGTQVTLEVTGPVNTTSSAVPPAATAETMILSRSWPALDEAVRALAAAEPAMAHHLVNQVLPRPDGQLAAGIQFFLMALRGGDLKAWFGDAPLRALERIRVDLKARLGDDFADFKRAADTPQPGDWRSYLIPFHSGRDIEPIRLYLRANRDEEEEAEKSKGTRFLLDVTLSRLGRIQLDGLVRQREKHMDLIVRSDHPFPARMRTDIQTIFSNAAEVTGMKGGLSFQAEPPRFVDVVPTASGPHDDTGLLV